MGVYQLPFLCGTLWMSRIKNLTTNFFLFLASKCERKTCSCSKSKIGCTNFCKCSDCENEYNAGNESNDGLSSDEKNE